MTAAVSSGLVQILPASVQTFWQRNILQGFFWTPQNTAAHSGVDFAMPLGTPVSSPVNGTVTGSSVEPWGGQVDVLTDLPGYGAVTLSFLHLSAESVQPGQSVQAGQVLGLSGQPPAGPNGTHPYGSGAHLHFELTHGSLAPYVTSYDPHNPTTTSYPLNPSAYIAGLLAGTQAQGQPATAGSGSSSFLDYLGQLQAQWQARNTGGSGAGTPNWPFSFPPPPPPPDNWPDWMKQQYYQNYIKQQITSGIAASNPLCGIPLIGGSICQVSALVQQAFSWLSNPARLMKFFMGAALIIVGAALLAKQAGASQIQRVEVVNAPEPPQAPTPPQAPSGGGNLGQQIASAQQMNANYRGRAALRKAGRAPRPGTRQAMGAKGPARSGLGPQGKRAASAAASSAKPAVSSPATAAASLPKPGDQLTPAERAQLQARNAPKWASIDDIMKGLR